MKPWIQKSAAGLAAVLLLAAAAVGTGLLLEQRRLLRSLHVPVQAVAIPAGAEAVARGRYLYESRGCADCHGLTGAGHRLVDDGGVHIAGPDITRGGSTRAYTPSDWVRAVRHGLAPGGRPLRVMPSEDFNRLTDADLGALVAYVHTLPAGGGAPAVVQLPLPARVLYGFGVVGDAADRIDHTRPPEPPVPEAPTVQHGRYVAQGCVGCHGPGLAGGRIPGAPPDWPAAPDLASGPGGVMARYADLLAFRAMMKSGKRPDGSAVAVMPFEALARLNEVDLQALHLYLQSGRPPNSSGPGG
jgi:mono/diheme cytochrome c family protein